jgi:cardiolipin synthase
LITLGRILLVPIIIWAIASDQMELAFAVFIVAGVSDAIDGFLAKRFNMTSELGALLDPLADKALLVSIYVTLGINDELPRWLVILVVSRDIMILGGLLLAWVLGHPIKVKPLLISKLNTAAQIVLASVVLGTLGLGIALPRVTLALIVVVALTAVASIAAYVMQWLKHMGSAATQ